MRSIPMTCRVDKRRGNARTTCAASPASFAHAVRRCSWPLGQSRARSVRHFTSPRQATLPTHIALRRRKNTAADLVLLDRLEQRLEISLAEAVVALSLDEFEEDRANHGLGEDLQQDLGCATVNHALAVN